MLKFIFYVPKSHLEEVKNAVFNAGAGKLGNYEECCWQTIGMGQFKPLANSNPYIGKENSFTQVEEYKVETVCSEDNIKHVILALKKFHPYECPVYDIWSLNSFDE